jgi:hypothetical protein
MQRFVLCKMSLDTTETETAVNLRGRKTLAFADE